jgi:serine/threonine-protein kinase
MAPEQLTGEPFDRRADVFALGTVLWEMLTMRRLFYAQQELETILRIRGPAPLEPPSMHRAGLPPRLDDVVLTMLARNLDERFCTCAAARAAMLVSCPEAIRVEPSAIAAPVEAAMGYASTGERTSAQRPSSRAIIIRPSANNPLRAIADARSCAP